MCCFQNSYVIKNMTELIKMLNKLYFFTSSNFFLQNFIQLGRIASIVVVKQT